MDPTFHALEELFQAERAGVDGLGLGPCSPSTPQRAGLLFYLTAGVDDVLKTVVCARLWALPGATVAGWIEAASGGPTLVAWATVPVPLTLSRSTDLRRDAR